MGLDINIEDKDFTEQQRDLIEECAAVIDIGMALKSYPPKIKLAAIKRYWDVIPKTTTKDSEDIPF